MFRRKSKLSDGVGIAAEAVVLNVTTIIPSTNNVSAGLKGGRYRVHARVVPDDLTPFEAKFNVHPGLPGGEPHEGQRIPVIFNPQDQGEVMWDQQTAAS